MKQDYTHKIKSILKHKVSLYFGLSIFIHSIAILIFSLLKGQGSNLNSYSEPVIVNIIDTQTSDSKNSSDKSTQLKNVTLNQTQKDLNTSQNETKNNTSRINFIGKSSAEIFEDQHYANNLSGTSNENYFKDNEFRPTKNTYDKYASHGAYGYTESGGIQKIFENNKFYSEVWKKVRHNAGFPKDFLALRLQGNVRIHALINEKGQLIGDFLNISAETDPVLALYSMAVLSLSLEKPLPETFWAKDKQIPMVFEFSYRHVYDQTDIASIQAEKKWQPEHQQANILKFKSSRYVDPILVQKIKELYIDYYPPIMPLAGGVFIDLNLLYTKYNHWKKHGFKLPSEVRNEELSSLREHILVALKQPNPEIMNKLKKGHFENSFYHNQKNLIDSID